MSRIVRKRKPDPPPASLLAAMMEKHLLDLRVRNYSEYTVKNRRGHIGFFIEWCRDRGLAEPIEVTRPILEHYQRYLFHYRQKNGKPLTFRSHLARLAPIRVWFRWMAWQKHILRTHVDDANIGKRGACSYAFSLAAEPRAQAPGLPPYGLPVPPVRPLAGSSRTINLQKRKTRKTRHAAIRPSPRSRLLGRYRRNIFERIKDFSFSC